MIINKKKRTCKIVDFAAPADNRIILKEREKKEKYLDLGRKIKKKYGTQSDDYTNRDWCFRDGNEITIKGTGGLGSWRTSGDHPNYSIIENGYNTEKSPGNLLSLKLQ